MRYLTGIKPTGNLHLGNYAGALNPMIQLSYAQENHDVIFMCADWHSLTDRQSIHAGGEFSLKVLSAAVVLGYNIKNHALILQSDFPQIMENSWYLASTTGVGLLERAHAYKDALDNGKDSTVSLFNYPVLMASDVLTFDTDFVPVGKDQLQHLEYASDMAKSFNFAVKSDVFKEPKPVIQEVPTLIGIDGTRKMSKSYKNEIPLFASKAELEKRIKEIKTDSKGKDEPKDPDSCLVYQLFQSFASEEAQSHMRERLCEGNNYGYGHAKMDFIAEHEKVFGQKREEFNYYLENPSELKKQLLHGYQKTHLLADSVLKRARSSLKLLNLKTL